MDWIVRYRCTGDADDLDQAVILPNCPDTWQRTEVAVRFNAWAAERIEPFYVSRLIVLSIGRIYQTTPELKA